MKIIKGMSVQEEAVVSMRSKTIVGVKLYEVKEVLKKMTIRKALRSYDIPI